MQVSLPFPSISCQSEWKSLHYSRLIKPCKCILNDFTVVIITLSSEGCAEFLKKKKQNNPSNKNTISVWEFYCLLKITKQMYEYNNLELLGVQVLGINFSEFKPYFQPWSNSDASHKNVSHSAACISEKKKKCVYLVSKLQQFFNLKSSFQKQVLTTFSPECKLWKNSDT